MSEATGRSLEIERKWMVSCWPEDTGIEALEALPFVKEESMKQGYVTTEPTVRIREEAEKGGSTSFILCFKSKGLMTRKEIEFPIDKKYFDEISDLIGHPLIPKIRRTYALSGGLFLEVNHVDEGLPTEFWYAEIEFGTENAAISFDPKDCGIEAYLNDEVTGKPGESMGAYWVKTRLAPSAKKE